MVVKLYAIVDLKTQVFMAPVCCYNDEHAMRVFKREFRREGMVVKDFPEDFQLYRVGTFSDSSGCVEGLEKPVFVCAASALVNWQKDE